MIKACFVPGCNLSARSIVFLKGLSTKTRDAIHFGFSVYVRVGERMVNDRGVRKDLAPIFKQEVERLIRQSDDRANPVVAVFLAQEIAHLFTGEAIFLQVFGVVFDRASGR